MQRPAVLLIAALAATAVLATTVDMRIATSWADTPLLAEASEAVAALQPEAFWAFLETTMPVPDAIRAQLIAEGEEPKDVTCTSPQIDQHAKALSAIPGVIFSPLQQKLARAELSARAFSPRVRAHHETGAAALAGSANRDNAACKEDAFVSLGANRAVVCDVASFAEALEHSHRDCPAFRKANDFVMFGSEHEFPSDSAVAPSSTAGGCKVHITLYGVLGTKRTADFVKVIRAAVKAGKSTAWFRHFIPVGAALAPSLGVQGYGVTLDVKNMEYKAVDEKDGTANDDLPAVDGLDVKKLVSRFPALTVNLTKFARKAAVSGSDLDLKVWEVQKLGYQAAHVILSNSDPMAAFVDLTENFPARVGRISQVEASPEFEATTNAVGQIQSMYGEGQTHVWLDGRPIPADKHDMFALLAAIRGEEALNARILAGLTGRKQNMRDFPDTVHRISRCAVTAPGRGEKPRLLVDESDVLWINDIEEDDMYSHLSESVNSILYPGPYGQPRFARRNLLNVIYVVDPTDRASLEALASFVQLHQQGAAVRFGVMFRFPEEDTTIAVDSEGNPIPTLAMHIASALQGLMKRRHGDGEAAMLLVRALHGLGHSTRVTHVAISEAYHALGGGRAVPLSPTAHEFMANWTSRVKRLGIDRAPVAIFNGVVYSERLDEVVYRNFGTEFGRLKQMVIAKALHDKVDSTYAVIHGDAVRRYQPAVFDSNEFAPWSTAAHFAALERLVWLHSADHNYDVCDLSHIVTFNANSTEGARDAWAALSYLRDCADGKCALTRFAFVPCEGSTKAKLFAALFHAAASLAERKRTAFVAAGWQAIVDATAGEENDAAAFTKASDALRGLGDKYVSVLAWSADFAVADYTALCRLLVPSGDAQARIHTNGRIVKLDATFEPSDISALESMERAQRGAPMARCVHGIDFAVVTENRVTGDDLTAEFHANKVAILSSIVAEDLLRGTPRTSIAQLPQEGLSHGFTTGAPMNASGHQLIAVVDPVSRSAQKIAALAKYLVGALNASVRIHFNPPQRVQKVPIKNYYRFVAEPELHFADGEILPPRATIKRLPTNVVLTLGIDDPDSWMVFADQAVDDLDNLKLTSDGVVTALYKLQSIVITGTCIDSNRGSPPRGLPIVLNDAAGTRDTLVMSNYGYFQLQGHPGVASLSIQPGRASNIFEIESLNDAPSTSMIVDSFSGAHADLIVRRQPGMETAELLIDVKAEADAAAKVEAKPQGLFSSLFGSGDANAPVAAAWPPAAGDRASGPSKPTLNIFSLASGHLYERFLRLMMYTVMKSSSDVHGKNTTRIKFWLIENPMSPRFKKLLPHLAAKYGFEYGLVKYKWPHWLTRQTEKQRMIWAYKVLFLDVLFPLDVDKVIFVDADQIIKADLHDLYNLDLHGQAVAYTPFCRNAAREDTKGFRFWDSGYWKDHLQGKPYHISAIYVVDLHKLRQVAAGDRYRMIYDNLAQDPNSLSNLDQDLPNFAQHQVPIYSLPEEWLWCETWCSDESKPKAKTIDLCNNPRTKTPKLDNAKRIIPEWEDMDKELADFEKSALGE